MPEKFTVGTVTMIAEPKMAAICERTNVDMTSPKAVAAPANRTAPTASARKLPVIGTRNATTMTSTSMTKLTSPMAM